MATLRATGTDDVRCDNAKSAVAGMVAGVSDNHCISLMTIDDTDAKVSHENLVCDDEKTTAVNRETDAGCVPLTAIDDGCTISISHSGSVRGSGDRPGLQTQCGL